MNFMLAQVADWVTKVFPVIRIVLVVLMFLIAVALIVLVFMQISSGSETSNAITGNKDSYYAQNKAGTKEGRVTRFIYIGFAAIGFLSILYFLSFLVYAG